MTMTAFLFPGQGSQFVGMGHEFHEADAWAREIYDLAESVTGKPIRRLCFEGPLEELTETANLQPAMTAVNLICHRALRERGLKPSAAAGHSLGEYSALYAAGVLSEEDVLKLVDLRGELMQRDAEARPGAMQVVVGLPLSEVDGITELARDRGEVVVANYNSPKQVVITGESEAVAAAAKLVKMKGGTTLALPVSGAWHSPLMKDATDDFASALDKATFSAPQCDIYLNVVGSAVSDPDEIRAIMARQISSSVRWSDCVMNMAASGIDTFVEVGPKKVLAGLVRKTVPRETLVTIINVQDPPGVDLAVEKIGGLGVRT